MFQFGFSQEKADTDSKKQTLSEEPPKEWIKSEEHFIDHNILNTQLLKNVKESVDFIQLEEKTIKHVSADSIKSLLKKTGNSENSILKADHQDSDLITAIYEGGLKVWQCTYDLLDYFFSKNFEFDSKNVLDLGCGAGILGLYAYLNKANVCFQDYNPEVIQYVTIPNVLLNTPEKEEVTHARFFSGDWESFTKLAQEKITSDTDSAKFDYILTSETIYNCDNYRKLNELFKSLLKPTGSIFLAAKTYYFGVGGGLRSFEDMITADDVFDFTNVWMNIDGVQREILLLKFKLINANDTI